MAFRNCSLLCICAWYQLLVAESRGNVLIWLAIVSFTQDGCFRRGPHFFVIPVVLPAFDNLLMRKFKNATLDAEDTIASNLQI